MDEREKEEAEQKEKQRKAKILADEKTEPIYSIGRQTVMSKLENLSLFPRILPDPFTPLLMKHTINSDTP